jgi:NNP family nitrate/nitrite transporter-like MFS transporter
MLFACWALNGVLVTFLVDNGIFSWSVVQVRTTGNSILTRIHHARLPIGILTDKLGGKVVFSLYSTLFRSLFLPLADSFFMFALLSFFFGLVGTNCGGNWIHPRFAPKEWQGRALGFWNGMQESITTFMAYRY